MKNIKSLQSALLMMVFINMSIASPPQPCGNAYGQKPCVFLPAKPGHTPKCAQPGSTFCEHVDDYPENLIKKLLKNYEARDILADEQKIDFGDTKKVTYSFPPYGHQPHHGNDHYGPSFANHHFNHNFNNYYHDNYHHRQQPVNVTPNKNGYFYPRPGPSSDSFFQRKPSFQSSHFADFYRRPTRDIQSILKFNETKEINFGTRFLNAIAPLNRTRRQTISADREQLCQVRSNYINPQAALNVRGNWMYIVNGGGDDMATQLVRTETCVSSQCSILCQLPNGYNSRCEQKYVQKRLITLDPQGEKLFTDTFWFPSCCVCTLSNS